MIFDQPPREIVGMSLDGRAVSSVSRQHITKHFSTSESQYITVKICSKNQPHELVWHSLFGLVVAEASSGSPEFHAVSWLQSLMRKGPGHNVPPAVQKLLDV